MKQILLITLSIMYSTLLFSQGEIQLNIKGLKSNKGQLIILLFKKENDFGVKEQPFRKFNYPTLKKGKNVISLKNIDKGEYAILVIHDLDKDGKCKTNWFGMPLEGIGRTGKSDGRPNFENSKFYFNGTKKTFLININHL